MLAALINRYRQNLWVATPSVYFWASYPLRRSDSAGDFPCVIQGPRSLPLMVLSSPKAGILTQGSVYHQGIYG